MANTIPCFRWNADQDVVSVKELQLPNGITASDVWGKPKEQPALLDIELILQKPFASAASLDKLDESTVHYGELAKRTRSVCTTQGQTLETMIMCVQDVIDDMALKGNGKDILTRSVVAIQLPKASMYGSGVTFSVCSTHGESPREEEWASQSMFELRDVRLMLLVGVNSYERGAKQPIVANLSLCLWHDAEDNEASPEHLDTFFKLERTLVEVRCDCLPPLSLKSWSQTNNLRNRSPKIPLLRLSKA